MKEYRSTNVFKGSGNDRKSSSRQKWMPSREQLENEIREAAFYIYLERGSSHGDDQADWYEAESQIKRQYQLV